MSSRLIFLPLVFFSSSAPGSLPNRPGKSVHLHTLRERVRVTDFDLALQLAFDQTTGLCIIYLILKGFASQSCFPDNPISLLHESSYENHVALDFRLGLLAFPYVTTHCWETLSTKITHKPWEPDIFSFCIDVPCVHNSRVPCKAIQMVESAQLSSQSFLHVVGRTKSFRCG